MTIYLERAMNGNSASIVTALTTRGQISCRASLIVCIPGPGMTPAVLSQPPERGCCY